MQLKLILLVIIALVSGVQAQEPKPRNPDGQSGVTNDDGGRAFIIDRDSALLPAAANRSQTPIAAPQQHSVFLGSRWATPELRVREPELANLLSNINDQATIQTLNESGIKDFFGPTTTREKLDDLSGRVSDLEIQAVLGGMLKDGSLPAPNPNTIYIVFLDPKLNSTLGTLFAGKHYAAYHNFLNAGGSKLHYVVVPFEPDRKVAGQISLRALIAAALNPDGTASN